METSKISITIGEHTFEAEGPPELVQSQFEMFSELVRSCSPLTSAVTVDGTTRTDAHQLEDEDLRPAALSGIMRVDGRVVSLTSPSPAPVQAALLIMLGQREMRSNLSSTGQEIGDGLEKTGYPVPRVYRLLAKEVKEQFVVTVGQGRSRRYRLTTQGLRKACALARALGSQEYVKDPDLQREADL